MGLSVSGGGTGDATGVVSMVEGCDVRHTIMKVAMLRDELVATMTAAGCVEARLPSVWSVGLYMFVRQIWVARAAAEVRVVPAVDAFPSRHRRRCEAVRSVEVKATADVQQNKMRIRG